MKVEYVAEVPQELLIRKKQVFNKKYNLEKLFSGEEKVAVIICDSKEGLMSAYSSIRSTLRSRGKSKEFATLKDTTMNKLYVYKA